MQNNIIQVKGLQKVLQGPSFEIWVALAWCVGIILLTYGIAIRVYKKRG